MSQTNSQDFLIKKKKKTVKTLIELLSMSWDYMWPINQANNLVFNYLILTSL